MKTLKLKHSLASGGNLSPQQDGATPGYRNGCMTISVTGLPDNATHSDAIRIVSSVMLPAWLDNVDASQAGKNLYRAENLTPGQLATAPDWYREKYSTPATMNDTDQAALAPLAADPAARFTLRAHELTHDGDGWSSNDRFTIGRDLPLAAALDAIAARFEVFRANYDDTATPDDLVTDDFWQPLDDETAGIHLECACLPFLDIEATGPLATLAPYLHEDTPPTREDLDGIRSQLARDRASFTAEELPEETHATRVAACDAWQAHLDANTYTYTVHVGNVGETYRGTDEAEARATFSEYCEQSRTNYGRAAGEPVALSLAGEPLEEFNP